MHSFVAWVLCLEDMAVELPDPYANEMSRDQLMDFI